MVCLRIDSVYRTEFRSAPAVEVEDDLDTESVFEPGLNNNFSINAVNETLEEDHLTDIRSPIEPQLVDDDEEEDIGVMGPPPPPFPRAFVSNPITRPFNEMQEDPLNKVLEELKSCTRLSCVIRVHGKLDGRTSFNFPHFFMIGYPFAGASHILAYLNRHSEFDGSISYNGPSWFNACQSEDGPHVDADGCNVASEEEYFQKFLNAKMAANRALDLVTVDTSQDYILAGGPLARRLYRYFPWLKLVIVIRDPITRLLAKITRRLESTNLNAQKFDTLHNFVNFIIIPADGTVVHLCDPKRQILGCMQDYMAPGLPDSNYSEPLEGWLTTFPKEQIHVIQFEEILEAPEKVMFDLKYFLGTNLGELVGEFSMKGLDTAPVTFRRGQYMRLVRTIESDIDRTLSLLHHHGLIGKKSWLARWEAGWQRVLSACDEKIDTCTVETEVLPM